MHSTSFRLSGSPNVKTCWKEGRTPHANRGLRYRRRTPMELPLATARKAHQTWIKPMHGVEQAHSHDSTWYRHYRYVTSSPISARPGTTSRQPFPHTGSAGCPVNFTIHFNRLRLREADYQQDALSRIKSYCYFLRRSVG